MSDDSVQVISELIKTHQGPFLVSISCHLDVSVRRVLSEELPGLDCPVDMFVEYCLDY